MNDVPTNQSSDAKPTPPVRLRRPAKVALIIIGAVLLSLLSGLFGAWLVNVGDNGGFTSFNAVKDDGNLVVTQDEKDITAVVEKVSPSVVSIVTSSSEPSFGGFVTQQAAGTGMIVSSDGYIMTNKHVIDGAKDATIILSNGKTYKNVPVIGKDPLNDVAFLKISGVKNLPVITLGDSKTVRTGQNVLAIGNALGQYQNTVTSGIISGLGRPVQAAAEDGSASENLSDLLQTDAAINAGNSGGPLLNLQGQVIGIDTAVAQDAQSIGFAIPIGATKGLLSHLIATGKIERAYLGVEYVSITPEVKDSYDLSVDQGDYITASSGSAVKAGSPAARAGLKKGDIIVKVNGVEVGPGKSTSTLLGEFQPGDTVKLGVLRGGSTHQVSVTLGAY